MSEKVGQVQLLDHARVATKHNEFYEMSELEKKQKKSVFGKSVKKGKKQLKRYGHKDY